MNQAQQHRAGAAAALSLENLPHATRLVAGALYGIAAGLLLHSDPQVAAIAMVMIWIVTAWRPAARSDRAAAETST